MSDYLKLWLDINREKLLAKLRWLLILLSFQVGLTPTVWNLTVLKCMDVLAVCHSGVLQSMSKNGAN